MPPILSVALLPDEIPAILPRLKAPVQVVAIDVLRATTMILAAFSQGIRRIIPVADLTAAWESKQMDPARVLAGEINGFAPEGFDMGNSPVLMMQQVVWGKEMVLFTTNGTRLLQRLSAETELKVYISAFANHDSLVEALSADTGDILLCCAGTAGSVSLEDTALAGLLVLQLLQRDPTILLSDGARIASKTMQELGSPHAVMAQSSHARYLCEAGFEEDVAFCAQQNHLPLLPIFSQGQLTCLGIE